MNIPNSLKEQIKADFFVHDKIIVVYFSVSTFNAVLNPKEANKQFLDDLPACLDNIKTFKEAMEHYGATKPEDVYNLCNESFKQCTVTLRNIQKRIQEDPETNYLILYVIAGHGMNVKGQQVLLLNEFDKKTNWYKMLMVETKIRTLAKICPNSYQVAFFGCCREVYDKSFHNGVENKNT